MIANKYRCTSIIGKGEFGSIYKAEQVKDKQWVALKKEPANSTFKLLKNETIIYQYLMRETGFPKVMWYGLYNDYYWMAIELLGDSLKVWKEKQNSLSIDQETVEKIGLQMFKRVETLHSKGLIHRDIKPDNFLWQSKDPKLDSNSNSLLYLIDFGFARKYLDEDGKHIAFRENKTPLGTLNYMSLNVHQGKEPSRRDDMESVIYCMIYLYDRKKPNESDDVNSIIEYKKLLREREDIPLSWRKYLYYLDHLGFEARAKAL